MVESMFPSVSLVLWFIFWEANVTARGHFGVFASFFLHPSICVSPQRKNFTLSFSLISLSLSSLLTFFNNSTDGERVRKGENSYGLQPLKKKRVKKKLSWAFSYFNLCMFIQYLSLKRSLLVFGIKAWPKGSLATWPHSKKNQKVLFHFLYEYYEWFIFVSVFVFVIFNLLNFYFFCVDIYG